MADDARPELGGGSLNIPIDPFLWPERPVKRRPFAVTEIRRRYIRRYEHLPWIGRALTEAFWQCRACGFRPWEDETWEWFSGLHHESRQALVRLSALLRRDARDRRTLPRHDNADVGGSGRLVEEEIPEQKVTAEEILPDAC